MDALGHTVSIAATGTSRARIPLSLRNVPSMRVSTRFTRPSGRPSAPTAENPWHRPSQYSRTAVPRPKPARVSASRLGVRPLNRDAVMDCLPSRSAGRFLRTRRGGAVSSADHCRAQSASFTPSERCGRGSAARGTTGVWDRASRRRRPRRHGGRSGRAEPPEGGRRCSGSTGRLSTR
jgi:hypothetical protein